MEIKIKFYDSLCETEIFIINDIEAYYSDFGNKYDEDPENAEDYGCGNMVFERKDSTKYVLDKYKISEKEYDEICDKLTDGLSFGCCGWCI